MGLRRRMHALRDDAAASFSTPPPFRRRDEGPSAAPPVDLPSTTHMGQLSNSTIHSPVRVDRRRSCMIGWRGHLPSSSMGVVVIDGNAIVRSVVHSLF